MKQHWCADHPEGAQWIEGPSSDCKYHKKVKKRMTVPGAVAGV